MNFFNKMNKQVRLSIYDILINFDEFQICYKEQDFK